jgi:hypothetical protein
METLVEIFVEIFIETFAELHACLVSFVCVFFVDFFVHVTGKSYRRSAFVTPSYEAIHDDLTLWESLHFPVKSFALDSLSQVLYQNQTESLPKEACFRRLALEDWL